MNRFAPIAVCFALLAGACGGSSDPETLPTLRLTTTTTSQSTTTEAPTTTATPTTTTTESTTTAVAQGFDPETAQAEIAQLINDFEDFWTFDNETPDPNDPRLEQLFTGDQLDNVRDLFQDISDKGQTVDGTTTLRLYPPALLTTSNQTATVSTCRWGRVALLDVDGTILVPADEQPLEFGFELSFVDGRWAIAAYGLASRREIPCDL